MRLTLTAGPESREWCDGCLTTAVLAFDLYIIKDDGVSPAGTYRACQRCGDV